MRALIRSGCICDKNILWFDRFAKAFNSECLQIANQTYKKRMAKKNMASAVQEEIERNEGIEFS